MAKLNRVTVLAPAKLNLALDVVGTLPNGYHDLDMTMQAITLYEKVVLARSSSLNLSLPGSPVACWRGWTSPSIRTCPCGPVWRAAVRMPPPSSWD